MNPCVAECEQAAGFVLAGGRSSRMGRDKALTPFAGRPLIETTLSSLRQVGIRVRIAGFRSDLSQYAEGVPDEIRDAGPLGGVYSALASSSARWNVFVPVDMPLVSAALLRVLLQRAVLTDALITAATVGGVLQPFPVVLQHAVLQAIPQHLAERSVACHYAWKTIPNELGGSLDVVSVEALRQSGLVDHELQLPAAYWFQGANTPAELTRLEHMVLRIRSNAKFGNDLPLG